MEKPNVRHIEGLSPSIAIEQKTTSNNPRSTVGTVTEIYDYLRLLYARIGKMYCPICSRPIEKQSVDQIVEKVLNFEEGKKIQILSPIIRDEKGEHKKNLENIQKMGFVRAIIDGELKDLSFDEISLDKNKKHNIDIVVDRLVIKEGIRTRLAESIEIAMKHANNNVVIDDMKEKYKFNERFSILIEKNIPVSAGIAGGSTNSAVVIEMIDEILGLNMSLDDKKQIGKSVGADIPYLLVGKTARTRGIGDELEILDSLPTTDILIVNNGVEIATPYVYSNIVPSGNSDRIDKLINVYKNKNYDEFFKGLYNVMEKVSISYCPEIQNIKDKMYEFNCIKSLMSGSGPTVFGIFNDDKDIKKAYDYFKKIYKNTFIVKTMER